MTEFFATISSYPAVIPSILLGIILFYWILACIGVTDFDSGANSMDADLNFSEMPDADGIDIPTIASYMMALGLHGVPFSIVATLLVLFFWFFTCIGVSSLLPLIPTELLRFAVGSAILLVAGGLSIPLTARCIRPLRPAFVVHRAMSNKDLVGQVCRVITGSVDEQFGRAEVGTRGASINIQVWAQTPNALTDGSKALILEYDEISHRYLIAMMESSDS